MDVFLDPNRPRQTAAMLFEQVRDAIAAGRLAPAARLPTSRWLADDLGISRSTVTTVYGQLVAEGLLTSRVGNGTFVAEHPVAGTEPPPRPDSVRLTRRRPPPAPRSRRVGGLDPSVMVDVVADLRTGRPDQRLFPLEAWRRAVKDAVDTVPPSYGDSAGLPALRAAIANWVGRSRGIDVIADQVLVTAGAQQAFDLFARILVAPGDTVAFEDPGYEPARRAFAGHGAHIQPVPVDREGLVVDEIDPTAQLVFVTPSHQSPTGVTMSARRRHELLDRAYRFEMAVVEDDYDTEYRYVNRPIEPLHRLDRGGRVVYLGTFSKSLSPSLRLGFVVASRSVIADLTAARTVTDVQPPHVTQAALANLIVTGHLDRHLRRTRAIYRERHDLVQARVDLLHSLGMIPTPWRSHAGLHSMVELHPRTDADAVCDAMARAGVIVDSTRASWYRDGRPGLVVGYGLADVEQLGRAFDALERVLAEALAA